MKIFRLPCIVIIVFFLTGVNVFGATVNKKLYINRGEILAVDSSNFSYMAFNNTPSFDKKNERLMVNVGDSLLLKIINNDTVTHGFNVKGYAGINNTILPGDSVDLIMVFNTPSVHIYYDSYNYPLFRYMGLAGMIVVNNNVAKSFFWNLKDHQKLFNDSIGEGNTVSLTDYYPDYFTINGNSNPHINEDSAVRVSGNVGDTLYIYMVNTGQSVHSIHFHGYHSQIIYSSKFPSHVGRSKDTFAVYSMESVILEMIPDKTGEYPVHDHNLVAVSGGHIYPNGMFLTMLIQ